MTDTPEYCERCYLEMDNIIDDVWMCQNEDPHFFQCHVHWGWNTFEEIRFVPAELAGQLARALLAERKLSNKRWLTITMALDY